MLTVDALTPITSQISEKAIINTIGTVGLSGDGFISHNVLAIKEYKTNNPKIQIAETNKNLYQQLFESGNSDLVHFIPAGRIVFPDFYLAMRTQIEHSKLDYIFCHSLGLPNKMGDEGKVFDAPVFAGSFNLVQFMVRRWVLNEVGFNESMETICQRIIRSYRGTEIKSVLCM